MNSSVTHSFRESFRALPPRVQQQALQTFRLWQQAPRHPSLQFKKTGRFWSVRVGLAHRALGFDREGTIYWFWIGDHDTYLRMLRS